LQNQTYRVLDANSILTENSVTLNTFYTAQEGTNTGALLDVEKTLASENTILATVKNEAVTPQNVLEDSYKQFYTALQHYQDSTFTPNDSLVIIQIAEGCPGLQGGAVFQSAALYNIVYTEAEVFTNLCPEYMDRSKQIIEDQVIVDGYTVFPVPNNGTCQLKGNLEVGTKVVLWSAEGQEVYEMRVTESVNELLIQTKLANGTYQVVLRDANDVEVFRQRIVIIH
jgi:uncharacterized phage infection (PIP) family protein YhgE